MEKSLKSLLVSIISVMLIMAMGFFSGAMAKEKVKIAFVGPLTGKFTKMGLGGRNSFELAINQQNASGKNKYHYEVVYLDDECIPAKGVQVVTKLCSDPDIIAACSHYCSMVAITTAEIFHRFGVANVVWGAVLPAITYGTEDGKGVYKEVTRVNMTMVEQCEFNVGLVVDKLGFKKFCIIHDTTDWGRGFYKWFEKSLKRRGIEPLSVDGVSIEQKDFTPILTKIKAEKPEVLYVALLAPMGVLAKFQMDKLGMKMQMLGTSGLKSEDFPSALKEHSEGVIHFLDGFPLEKMPGGRKFMKAYKKAGYKLPWEAYGPFAYCAANTIVRAIEAVGPDRAKVIDAIAKTDYEDIIGRIHYNEYGQNDSKLVTAYVYQDATSVPWDESEYASGKRILPGLSYKKGLEWKNPYKK